MPWTAAIQPDLAYVEIVYSGQVTSTELEDAFNRALELGRTMPRPRFLADCTTITGGASISGLYFLADQFAAAAFDTQAREALILPVIPELADSLAFWETACANRGLSVRIFGDRAGALDWLLEAD